MGKEEFGFYLKEQRVLAGKSLRDVERDTEKAISNAYLSQLESGQVENPSPRILTRLAEVYHVTVEEMMKQAGYIKQVDAKQKRAGIATLVGQDVSAEERKELIRYLEFMRSHRNRKAHEKG